MKRIEVKYTIDKGVPIPVRRETDVVPISKLKEGDSLAFPLSKRPIVQSNASRIKKAKGWEYTISKISDNECRIWRVK